MPEVRAGPRFPHAAASAVDAAAGRPSAAGSPDMTSILRSRVPEAAAGMPLLQWLAARFGYHGEPAWRREIEAGAVLHNGARANAEVRLHAGDEIAYLVPPAPPGPVPAIVLDDPDFVAIDKPPHLVAHAASAFAPHTFLDALQARVCPGAPLQFVHRLDRETSGLLLLGKGSAATARLQAQFAAGEVHKAYLALVRGNPPAQRFSIDAPIGRAKGGAIAARRAVCAPGDPRGKPARTEVEVLEQPGEHALLRLSPATGRTHQLRVHLAHVGLPLVGDKLYSQDEAGYLAYVAHVKAGGDPSWDLRLGAGRQLLHAAELGFAHPRTGEPVRLEAVAPADFAAFLAKCRDGTQGP